MASAEDKLRDRLPDPDAIVHEKEFVPGGTAKSRAGPGERAGAAAQPRFRILRTNESDPYDAPLPRGQIPLIGAAKPPGDSFAGTSRKAAKLSLASAKVEAFDDVADLIKSLPADAAMAAHEPPITVDKDSNRVSEEKRNVRVKAFLYAASRENDNDFHLIVGRNPKASPRYMTMELSALPPKTSKFFARLKKARDAYKAFFKEDLPGPTYDFYDPPIPVEIEGSLFFDMSHAHGLRPGPSKLQKFMPTIFEIHPISKIVLGP